METCIMYLNVGKHIAGNRSPRFYLNAAPRIEVDPPGICP